MPNSSQLARLRKGTKEWNKWRENNLFEIPILSEVDLSGANLREAYLSWANLSGANLSWSNLSWAYLSWADLSGANLSWSNLSGSNLSWTDLNEADLRSANLRSADLRSADLRSADLRSADLSEANLKGANLKGANLKGANLKGANLKGANLKGANLKGADLSEVNFSRIQALRTNFQDATLTGACLEDWNINSETILDGVICDYVYLKADRQERRPSDPNKNFAPGEFSQLFQKVTETVALIFSDGIDWKAFLKSFKQLQKEQKLQLQVEDSNSQLPIVRALENKDDGTLVLRVSFSSSLSPAQVEKSFWQKYLPAKKTSHADLMEIIKFQASQPIQIPNLLSQTNKTQSNSLSEKRSIKIDPSPTSLGTGYGKKVEAQKIAVTINETHSKSLAETAAEIQELLEQLSQTYPTSTSQEKMTVVAEAVAQIEQNPTLKARVINTLKAGETEAFKEAIDHPLINLLMTSIEGWPEAE